MHPMLNTAVKAARLAGTIINRASLNLDKVRVSRKAQNDYVTEVDSAAEQIIIETLLEAYPDHSILAEESGQTGSPDAEYVWIIDPLDGTTNFIHGFPHYAVSIALQHRGVITQACIYDPTRNDLFTATKGEGAYCNERRIRVSKCEKMADALIGTGFPFRDMSKLDLYTRMFKTVTEQAAGLRRPGAASLDLAYVAMGRFDAFFETGLAAWDVAAGALLITEAGGLVGNFMGEQNYLHAANILAGAPRVFGQLVSLLEPFAAQVLADTAHSVSVNHAPSTTEHVIATDSATVKTNIAETAITSDQTIEEKTSEVIAPKVYQSPADAPEHLRVARSDRPERKERSERHFGSNRDSRPPRDGERSFGGDRSFGRPSSDRPSFGGDRDSRPPRRDGERSFGSGERSFGGDRPSFNRDAGRDSSREGSRDSRPPRADGERSFGRPSSDRPSFGGDRDSRPPRHDSERSFGGDRSGGDRPSFSRDGGRDSRPPRADGERSFGRPSSDRPSFGSDRDSRPPRRDGERSFGGDRSGSERSFGNDRPSFNRDSSREGGRDAGRDSRPPRRDGERSFGGDRTFGGGERGGFAGRRDVRSTPRADGERSFGRPSSSRPSSDRPSFGGNRDSRPPRRDESGATNDIKTTSAE
jgi:myo-inositol-1(or 4)-monophosphatase